MPASRHKILRHVFGDICSKLNRTKRLSSDASSLETPLKRCLSTFDITLLGIGHMVGAGIYVLTGTVAKDLAGPGIILSFILAGIASTLAALCYAEFGARVPKAGSAYVYTYVSIGEFWAFVIGWNIVLEHMIGAASVARAWSGYVDSLLGSEIKNTTRLIFGEISEDSFFQYPDILSFVICILYSIVLAVGVKGSAIANSVLTGINLGVILLVISVGFYNGKFSNWSSAGGFLPYGLSGVISGAATCFYAYVGFDCIASSGEEATDPVTSIPIATILAMIIVSLIYIFVSAALTLMVPYSQITPDAALPEAFNYAGLHWLSYVIVFGAICGMTTSLLGSLFSLPRCLYSMAEDGLIFSFFSKISRNTQLPLLNIIASTLMSAIIALFFELEVLVEFMSIGTLLAYTIVSAAVIILRYRPSTTTHATVQKSSSISDDNNSVNTDVEPIYIGGRLKESYIWLKPFIGDYKPGLVVSISVYMFIVISVLLCANVYSMLYTHSTNAWFITSYIVISVIALLVCLLFMEAHEQNTTGLKFKVPFVPYLPALSILCNIELMANLNFLTWVRFVVWMILGLLLYFGYGIHRSKLNETVSSYSVLLSPNGGKQEWGTIKEKRKSEITSFNNYDDDDDEDEDDDTKPIIDSEHVTR